MIPGLLSQIKDTKKADSLGGPMGRVKKSPSSCPDLSVIAGPGLHVCARECVLCVYISESESVCRQMSIRWANVIVHEHGCVNLCVRADV